MNVNIEQSMGIPAALWELIRLLPPTSATWATRDREAWFTAWNAVMELCYPVSGETEQRREQAE